MTARRLSALAVVMSVLASPALAHAAPAVQRPNPAIYPVTLDYSSPLPGAAGSPAALPALGRGVILAAITDREYLAYKKLDDLGGFEPARVDAIALSSGGHDVLHPGAQKTQIPLYSQAAGGRISSYTFAMANPDGGNGAPDNGKQPVPPIGVPPPPPAPTGSNTVPPANQGFGGEPGGGQSHAGGSHTTTTTTTTTGGAGTTTTTPAITAATTTTPSPSGTSAAGTGGGGSGAGSGSGCSGGTCAAGACGVPGVQVDSSAAGCTVAIADAVPGDSGSETWTIKNTTGAPYTLSIGVDATPSNHLLGDLQMGVWDASGTPPATLPPLTSWTAGFSNLTTLNPGQTVQYEVELYLPTTAGNADQGETVSITLHWHAQG
jgi:hypothetical protein